MNERLEFLRTVRPFDVLPDDVLLGVADLLTEVAYNKESVIYLQEVSKMRALDIVVAGEYEAFFYDSEQNKRLPERYGPGNCYGGVSILLNKKRSIRTVIARKGTRVYQLHRSDFRALCQAYEGFFHYFTAKYGQRMLNDEYAHFVKPSHAPEENYIAADQLYTQRMETVEYRELLSCPRHLPVFQAARLMCELKSSCLFVTDEAGTIVGYVTDMSLRDNVVAQCIDPQRPVQEVMDTDMVSIGTQAYMYEAILLMFRTKTRYLLIERDGEYIGFTSRNKLLSDQAQSPMMFIQSVRLAQSDRELRGKWRQVPNLVYQLLNRGVKPDIVNQIITAVSDTIALKVIDETIQQVGPPPARFVFMVLGSEGRKEQTLLTDQDNAIIYEDKANEHREEVRAYFLDFATRVSDRLNYVGFSFCDGGYMAKNPKWTHSLSHWKRDYTSWISEATPETGMNFSAFFDCRYLYGEAAIMSELKDFLNEEMQRLPLERFLYYMAKNALQYEPPLTFFNNIRTITKGNQQVFNLKKTMSPIVDLIRVFALRNRVFLTNTGERLAALQQQGVFTEKEGQELLQAYYYLMGLRLKKQASQIIHDKTEPDNYQDVNTLTKVEQVTLKEIFKVIQEFQLKMKVGFTKSL